MHVQGLCRKAVSSLCSSALEFEGLRTGLSRANVVRGALCLKTKASVVLLRGLFYGPHKFGV